MTSADLRAWRVERGISREVLAVFSGVSRAVIGNFEGSENVEPKNIDDATYWKLYEAKQTLTDGGVIVSELQLHPTRGGAEIICRNLTDPDAVDRALDEIVRSEGASR